MGLYFVDMPPNPNTSLGCLTPTIPIVRPIDNTKKINTCGVERHFDFVCMTVGCYNYWKV